MPKFRKKPVVVHAAKWRGTTPSLTEILSLGCQPELSENGTSLMIHTNEGVMEASLNDWIIRGTAGEFYPCKSNIFAQIYEPAE